MTGTDMSSDELSDEETRINSGVLTDQVRRRRWQSGISSVALVFVIVFYLALLYYIFCGSLRNAAWIWSIDDGKWLALADIPIMVALSTIPTLILMALLRHYHSNGLDKAAGEDDASPLALQVCREALRSLGEKP